MCIAESVSLGSGLELLEDGLGEVLGGGVTTNIGSGDLLIGQDTVDGIREGVGVLAETDVTEHHGTGEEHGGGVSDVLVLDVQTDVTGSGLEDSVLAANANTRNNTGATDETSTDVGEDVTVKVRSDQHLVLLGVGDGLHGAVVDNDGVGLDLGVELLANVGDGVAEQTVTLLHDVGLVDGGDLGEAVGLGEVESEASETLDDGLTGDLERLNHTRDGVGLQTGVLTLGVLTNDDEVDIVVTGVNTRQALEQRNTGEDVQVLTQLDVEGRVTGADDGGVENPLQTNLGALERPDGLEVLLGGLSTVGATGDTDLLEVNGNTLGLEDLLDTLGHSETNTVTRDQGDLVAATVAIKVDPARLLGEGAKLSSSTQHFVYSLRNGVVRWVW